MAISNPNSGVKIKMLPYFNETGKDSFIKKNSIMVKSHLMNK